MRRNQQIQVRVLDLKTFAQIFVAQTAFVGVHPMSQTGVAEQQMLNAVRRA
jgi:hypothetical protein